MNEHLLKLLAEATEEIENFCVMCGTPAEHKYMSLPVNDIIYICDKCDKIHSIYDDLMMEYYIELNNKQYYNYNKIKDKLVL
jgi:hypothetical protein